MRLPPRTRRLTKEQRDCVTGNLDDDPIHGASHSAQAMKAIHWCCVLFFLGLGWGMGSYQAHHQDRQSSGVGRSPVVHAAGNGSAAVASGDANQPQRSAAIQMRMEKLASKNLGRFHDGDFAAAFFNEVEDLPQDQFRELIAALMADPSWQNTDAAELLVGLWAERDLPAALEWVKGLKSKSGPEVPPADVFRLLKKLSADQDYAGTYYMFWASRDPASAAVRALLEPETGRRSMAISQVVTSWSGRDPEAVHAWVEQLQDPVLASEQRAQIGNVIGWNNPEKGATYLASIPQNDPARKVLQSTLSSWKKRGLAAPLAWASGLEKESVASWAFAEIVREAAPEKIDAAIAELPFEARARARQRWNTYGVSKAGEMNRQSAQ